MSYLNTAIAATGSWLKVASALASSTDLAQPTSSAPVPDLRPDSKLELLVRSGRFDAVALNPQPLPPRESSPTSQSSKLFLDDDWCPTKPTRFPPPPPPPVLNLVSRI